MNLEKNARFMDAVHTYEQSNKMLVRVLSLLVDCIIIVVFE